MDTAPLYHPGLGGEVAWGVQAVPEDADGQVAGVISIMAGYVREDAKDPLVQAQAWAAVPTSTPTSTPRDILNRQRAAADRQRAAVDAVWQFARRNIRFVQDEETLVPFQDQSQVQGQAVEALIRPRDMALYIHQGRALGDCDDFSMYVACLLRALGVESKFVTVAADPEDPSRFSHVYVAATLADGSRVPLDASHGDRPGWETPGWYRKREWDVGTTGVLEALLAVVAGWWLWDRMQTVLEG